MDFDVINKAIAITENLFDGFDEQPVDSDFTLPDYYPDISAVLKCTLTPIIQSNQISGDRVTVDGIAVVDLLYLDEERKTIHSLDFTKAFSSVFNVKLGTGVPFVGSWAKTDYVNCRALSPRRLDVHGSFSVKLKVQTEGSTDVVSEMDGDSIQTRRSLASYTVPALSSEKTFTVSEVLDIGLDNPNIENIIRNDISCKLSEAKILANKAIIKGEVIINTLYITDTENGNTFKLRNEIPFSQILDAEGLTEEDICDVALAVISSDIRIDSNQNGENRLIDISAKVNSNIQTFTTGEAELLVDAYSTNFPLVVETKNIELEQLEDIKSDIVKIKEEFDLPTDDVSEIVDIWCEASLLSTEYLNGMTSISAKLTTHMLARDFEGGIAYYERSGDISFDFEDNCNRAVIELSIIEVDFSKSGSSKCEIYADINVKRYCYNTESVVAIVDAEASEDAKFPEEKVAIKIYFANKGESVWEVAKACHASVDQVMEANSLYDDVLAEDTKILVPLN